MHIQLPKIGLGAWSLVGKEGAHAITQAIDNGYTLIDTAYNYENEGVVGKAIADSSVDRENLLITSKLPGKAHRPHKARIALEESLYRAGLDYFDLYLIHWPNPRQGKYVMAWEALIQAKEDGLVKHIGVSNFTPEHIEMLVEKTGVKPEVNQVELHPLFPQEDLVAWSAGNEITVEAWSPLGRGEVLTNPELVRLAEEHGVSVGELLISWHATRGVVPLARSSNSERQVANLRAAERTLDEKTTAAITALGQGGGRLWDQNPDVYEEF